MRAILLDQGRKSIGDLVDRCIAERIRMAIRLPTRHPGVVIAEHLEVTDAQVRTRTLKLCSTQHSQGHRVMGWLARITAARAEAEGAVGAGHEHRANTFE